jgi:nitrogen fixation NifU-like protein
MLSSELVDHFQNPRNVGELQSPAIVVEVTNPACGDIIRLSALFTDGKVAQVRYKVRGCAASIAAGSALTVMIEGKTPLEIGAVTATAIESMLGGLAPASKHAASLCHDALRALIKASATANPRS